MTGLSSARCVRARRSANITGMTTPFFTALALALLLGGANAASAEDPVIPLPAAVAKDLAVLGEGVVGKALPAPPIDDIREYLNLGPGSWDFQIVAGGKEGQKVRTESYKRMPDQQGAAIWERRLGDEYVEYLTLDPDGGLGKHREDDVDLGYTSRFLPAVTWLGSAKPGTTVTTENKIEAYKTPKPGDISYTGKMTSALSYVGAYEITTPAGTWPAILLHSDFHIKIGPADVDDSMYVFYVKGVGKVAEIESTRISALFIYHSNTKVAKVLKSRPTK